MVSVSSLNAASSCFFATTKRSKIMFICRPSTILVVKLPHCVLRANIQKICHHRKCIKVNVSWPTILHKGNDTEPTKYGMMIWYQFKLERSIKLFFRGNQAIQNHVHPQTLNDLGGKASALRAQGKYSEDMSSHEMCHTIIQ